MAKIKKLIIYKKHLVNLKEKTICKAPFLFKSYLIKEFQELFMSKYLLISKNIIEKSFAEPIIKEFRAISKFESRFRNYIILLKYLSKKYTALALSNHLIVRFSSNNIFVTLNGREAGKTLINCSLGKLKVRGSKKNLAYISTDYLWKAFDKVKPFLKKKLKLKLTLISPLKHREYLCETIGKITKYKKPIIYYFLPDNKCYNGCRPRKCIRKKRANLYLRKK